MSNVKMIMANKSNRQALQEWEEFLSSIRNSTPVDLNETDEAKAARIKKLEGSPEDWFKYYFPKYCFADPADFHKKSTKRFLKAKRIFQRRAWARGLAKSTRRMMEVFFKTFAKKFPTNLLLISKSEGNAIRLLAPYKANLEANQRLINDYGSQEKIGSWAADEFITRGKHGFRAVGAEQNPRGAKIEERRVNIIIFDDVDDDEVCRNPERVSTRWKWIQEAVIPTVDISLDYAICFDNNVIAEDSCSVRAQDYATDDETVNIRDENAKSVWKKNSEKDIDDLLALISYESGQKEFFNNPLGEGKAFKELIYGKCPPMKEMPLIVIYGDPSSSNKDKPLQRSMAKTSCKAVVVVGCKDEKYFVYNCFVYHTTNATFIDWLYTAYNSVVKKTQPYVYVENNGFQTPHYEQVLMPLVHAKGKENGGVLPLSPDGREKPDKWFRIEGTLEPINRMGLLILNIDEKDNPHMKRLEAQFKAASAICRTMDGPDAVEGAVYKIKHELFMQQPGVVKTIKRPKSKKRF
jgi:hypothetical protein